jgi:8-oxo-dGTP pyrophosphatase MutT (NUDIX family)
MSTTPEIVRLQRLELAVSGRPWPFAQDNRQAISQHFDKVLETKPAAWNGRVLLLCEHAISDGVFRGAYLETDYASMITWRDWGFPDSAVTNCFALGALRTTDGAFLLGVMGAHTLNPGRIYFPAGTPEPRDVVDGMVDLAGSIRREVAEETGLETSDYEAEEDWTCVLTRTHIAQIQVLHAREDAAALRARILANLARERQPELADIRIARNVGDFDPMMPPFITAFLADFWRCRA